MEAQAEFHLALFAVSFWEYVSKIEELATPVQVRGIGVLRGVRIRGRGESFLSVLRGMGAPADFRRG